jgi:hypothetical protein
MTIFYSGELAGIASLPLIKAANAAFGARLRRYRGSVTLAAQTTSDTIVIGQAPAGASFAYGVLTSSVSLGTSTIAIGVTGTTGKYRAAATFTTVDTPTLFGPNTAVGGNALAAAETQFITIAVATLPGAGLLVVDMYWSCP